MKSEVKFREEGNPSALGEQWRPRQAGLGWDLGRKWVSSIHLPGHQGHLFVTPHYPSSWFPSQHSCVPGSFPLFLSSSLPLFLPFFLPSFSCWLYVSPTRRQVLWEQDFVLPSAVPRAVPGMQLVFNKCVKAGGWGRQSGNQESKQAGREGGSRKDTIHRNGFMPLLIFAFYPITSERFILFLLSDYFWEIYPDASAHPVLDLALNYFTVCPLPTTYPTKLHGHLHVLCLCSCCSLCQEYHPFVSPLYAR